MAAKKLALAAARAGGLFALARRATRGRLRILCYHGLWTTPGFQYGEKLFMRPKQFEARMQMLARSSYPVLPLGEAVEALGEDRLPDGATVITIDDGWASTYTHMLPVLERLRLPSTLYVTSWYVGRDLPVVNKALHYLHMRAGMPDNDDFRKPYDRILGLPAEARADALKAYSAELGIPLDWWDTRQFHLMTEPELMDAQARGMDLQLHTHRHTGRSATLDRELRDNLAALMRQTGLPAEHFQHFCYPSGRFEPKAKPILEAAGVKSATLTDEGLNAPAQNPFELMRFMDGRNIDDIDMLSYLSGVRHFAKTRRAGA